MLILRRHAQLPRDAHSRLPGEEERREGVGEDRGCVVTKIYEKTSHDEKRTMFILGASADLKRQSGVKNVHERSYLGETVSLFPAGVDPARIL